jgi:cytochrome P450
LIVAGNETVRNTTTSGMRLLIEHPEQLQFLIENPDKIGDAVEEILRFRLPVLYFRRTSKVNIELGGKQIKKGDKIMKPTFI